MKKLIQGIVDFRKNISDESKELFAKLALGQKPDTLFIACSDSRVVPNLFASTNPGDLFVLRNVGNFVPPASLAFQELGVSSAIEYAVLYLKVSDIIVCGHSECGAIQALLDGSNLPGCHHLNLWLKYGKESLKKFQDEPVLNPLLPIHNQVSRWNVLQQLEHLATYSFIQEHMENNKLRLHGWWFDITHAEVYCYEKKLHQFVIIDETEAKRLLENFK